MILMVNCNILTKIQLDYQTSIFDAVFTLNKLCVNVAAMKKNTFTLFLRYKHLNIT